MLIRNVSHQIADLTNTTAEDGTQLISDVHPFPDHIACGSAPSSELIIPICSGGEIVGDLDLDNPQIGLEALCVSRSQKSGNAEGCPIKVKMARNSLCCTVFRKSIFATLSQRQKSTGFDKKPVGFDQPYPL